MRSWSIPLFHIRGIQLALHGSFLLLLAYVAWMGWGEGGAPGLWWNSLTLIGFFTCVVLHELGHSLTARRYGVHVRRILLMPIGGMAEFDSIPRRPSHELVITIAGPAVNFVIAGLLWFVLPRGEVLLHSFQGFLLQLFFANLVMGVFNLLPAFPMDGGRILRAALATRLPYLRATRIAANVGKLFCVTGAAVAVLGHHVGIGWFEEPAWLLAALFAFIFFAGEAEYRSVLRRERDEAHWREMLTRHVMAAPVAPVLPPLLPRNEPNAREDASPADG